MGKNHSGNKFFSSPFLLFFWFRKKRKEKKYEPALNQRIWQCLLSIHKLLLFFIITCVCICSWLWIICTIWVYKYKRTSKALLWVKWLPGQSAAMGFSGEGNWGKGVWDMSTAPSDRSWMGGCHEPSAGHVWWTPKEDGLSLAWDRRLPSFSLLISHRFWHLWCPGHFTRLRKDGAFAIYSVSLEGDRGKGRRRAGDSGQQELRGQTGCHFLPVLREKLEKCPS